MKLGNCQTKVIGGMLTHKAEKAVFVKVAISSRIIDDRLANLFLTNLNLAVDREITKMMNRQGTLQLNQCLSRPLA